MKSEIKIIKSIVDIQKEEQLGYSLKIIRKDIVNHYITNEMANCNQETLEKARTYLTELTNDISYSFIIKLLTSRLTSAINIVAKKKGK